MNQKEQEAADRILQHMTNGAIDGVGFYVEAYRNLLNAVSLRVMIERETSDKKP